MDSRDDDVVVLSSEDASDTDDTDDTDARDATSASSDEEPRAGWPGAGHADYAVGSSGVASPADEASDAEASDAEADEVADTAVSPEPAVAADATVPDTPAPAAAAADTPVRGALAPENGDAWPQIQALFVDDPRAAVRQAADAARGSLAALVAAARNREQALGGWEDGGTEELRGALREFRDLASRAGAIAREL